MAVLSGTHSRGLDSVGTRFAFEAGVDIPVNSLVYVKKDVDGIRRIYIATNAITTGKMATGIMYETSVKDIGGAVADENAGKAFKGRMYNVETFMIVTDETAFATAEIGDKVYLGVDGELTLTATAVVGELLQEVGRVVAGYAVRIDLMKPEAELVA